MAEFQAMMEMQNSALLACYGRREQNFSLPSGDKAQNLPVTHKSRLRERRLAQAHGIDQRLD